MFTKEEPINLFNLGNGAAMELFDEELQKVLDNIVDPNTEPIQARKVTLTVVIKPDEDRTLGAISIECTSKTSSSRKFTTRCILGKNGRRGEARELDSQTSFIEKGGNVVPFSEREEK